MLRAVRLAAKLGFEIEPASAAPIAPLSGLLSDASSARLFDESLKLFLAGHGERSFVELERQCLAGQRCCPTPRPPWQPMAAVCAAPCCCAGIVQYRRAGQRRQIGDAGLPVRRLALARLCAPSSSACLSKASTSLTAEQRAADRVTLRQIRAHRLATSLQRADAGDLVAAVAFHRLRQKKRVMRVLSHPRFRAAFDFLELRASVVPELQEEFAFWREAQGMPPDELADKLTAAAVKEDSGAHTRKRRRRRGGGGGGRTRPPANAAE
ncbi:MAG: hypothetical protein LKM39_07280 [Chiayiivirga sp.]|nr:hypothetical protein [Chiayiivirga sp.]